VDLTLNAPLDSANSVIDVATSAVEPTLQSLGLVSSFPGGFIQAGLENLHVGLGVPWWTSIVIGNWLHTLTSFVERKYSLSTT